MPGCSPFPLPKRNLKNTDFVDMMISKIKHDLLLSVNQPMNSAYLEFIGIHFILFGATAPQRARSSSFTRFLDHTHNDALQSVGLLWTRDQLVAQTST